MSSSKLATPFSPPIEPPRRPLLWAVVALVAAGFVVGRRYSRISWGRRVLSAVACLVGIRACARNAVLCRALAIQLRSSIPVSGGDILAFVDGRETVFNAYVTHEAKSGREATEVRGQSIDMATEEVATAVLNNFRPREL